MSEKTEKPTRYKLKKAKEKGEVAKSAELASAILLTGALLFLWGLASLFDRRLKEVFCFSLQYSDLNDAFWEVFSPVLLPMILIFLGLMSLAVASHLFQSGWIWKFKKKKKGGQRIFLFPLLKLVAAGIVGYGAIRFEHPSLQLLFSTAEEKEEILFKKIFFVLLVLCALFLVLGIFDFFYQKWRFYKQMHMTPQELREEKKETEGNTETKSSLRKSR